MVPTIGAGIYLRFDLGISDGKGSASYFSIMVISLFLVHTVSTGASFFTSAFSSLASAAGSSVILMLSDYSMLIACVDEAANKSKITAEIYFIFFDYYKN